MTQNQMRIFRVGELGEASGETNVIPKLGREQVPVDLPIFDSFPEKVTVQTGTIVRMNPPLLRTVQSNGRMVPLQLAWNIFPIETAQRLECS